MKRPIADRIAAAMKKAAGRMPFKDLAWEVFPHADYPRAWRGAAHGGPPGCYMVLSAALRRSGKYIDRIETTNGHERRMVSVKKS